jgi:hypothetical protein
MDGTELTGACLCGAVRFEVTGPLLDASYCQCTRCQRRTGTAASVSARLRPGSLRVISGEEHARAYQPETGRAKVFCTQCGSGLWGQDGDDPDSRAVRLGLFDTDPGVRPSSRQFVAYAAPWEPIPDDGLPRYPERRP